VVGRSDQVRDGIGFQYPNSPPVTEVVSKIFDIEDGLEATFPSNTVGEAEISLQ
jgi:hypothetical protein